MSMLPARMKNVQLKMNSLEWPQICSNYKCMGIFPDAQSHVSPQTMIESGRISNSAKLLWLFSLPARTKKDPTKNKGYYSFLQQRFFSVVDF